MCLLWNVERVVTYSCKLSRASAKRSFTSAMVIGFPDPELLLHAIIVDLILLFDDESTNKRLAYTRHRRDTNDIGNRLEKSGERTFNFKMGACEKTGLENGIGNRDWKTKIYFILEKLKNIKFSQNFF